MFVWGKFIIQYCLWKNCSKTQQQSKESKIGDIILESLKIKLSSILIATGDDQCPESLQAPGLLLTLAGQKYLLRVGQDKEAKLHISYFSAFKS